MVPAGLPQGYQHDERNHLKRAILTASGRATEHGVLAENMAHHRIIIAERNGHWIHTSIHTNTTLATLKVPHKLTVVLG